VDNDVTGGHPPAYSGGHLDRAGTLRADPSWIERRLADPRVRVIPLWQSRCLIGPGGPVRLVGADAAKVLAADAEPVFLGLTSADEPVFAVDLSDVAEPEALAAASADRVLDVRAMAGELDPAEVAIQAHARGMLHWRRNQRHCGSCGARTRSRADGGVRICTGCGRELYPQLHPAVIAVVESPDGRSCLLARHCGAGPDGFSLLAGFVDVGESLEDAVRREVFEETGVHVGEVAYLASQAWPFPAGLMVGFRARALSEQVTVDPVEIEEARWFTRDELRQRQAAGGTFGRVDSVDRLLMQAWL